MTSLFTDMFSEFASPAMREYLGADVIHYPGGVIASLVTITDAIWNENEPVTVEDVGENTMRTGVLQVPSTTTVTHQDAWKINDTVWDVETIGPERADWLHVGLKRFEEGKLVANRH